MLYKVVEPSYNAFTRTNNPLEGVMKNVILNLADRHFGWIVKYTAIVIYGVIGGSVLLINAASAYGIH